MLKSMTGFGQVNETVGDATLAVEVKTLNSKFMDLSLRLPKIFAEKELEVRNIITDKLERGKVAVTVEYLEVGASVSQQYDEAAFVAHYAELKKLADKVMAPYDNLFELALKSSDTQQAGSKEALDPVVYEKFVKALNATIALCENFRKTEGATLQGKLTMYIQSIAQSLKKVEVLDPQRVEKIRARIKKGVTDFFGEEGFDQNRLEQEIIFYIEKLDIHEERVRLKTHLDYFLKVMGETQSNGKKLAFIAQEIGREINTIGSKSNDAEMQKDAVLLKEELEKVKEQLSNVL